jgi:hypothetical protein
VTRDAEIEKLEPWKSVPSTMTKESKKLAAAASGPRPTNSPLLERLIAEPQVAKGQRKTSEKNYHCLALYNSPKSSTNGTPNNRPLPKSSATVRQPKRKRSKSTSRRLQIERPSLSPASSTTTGRTTRVVPSPKRIPHHLKRARARQNRRTKKFHLPMRRQNLLPSRLARLRRR